MAFGSISTLHFPIAANAGTSQWGTDVRKLLDAAESTSDSTTTTRHGTGATVRRTTVDPYNENNQNNLTEANYGWAVTPSDMNSVSGSRRVIKAGNHTFIGSIITSGLAATDGTIHFFAYRVGNAASGRARTLLGSVDQAQSFAVLAANSEVTVPLSLPEIIFEPDETIQYSFELSAPGGGLANRTLTFNTGVGGALSVRITLPAPLTILRDTVGSSAGAATAAGEIKSFGSMAGSSAGAATVTGAVSSMASVIAAAAGVATVDGVGSSTAATAGTAAGVATVDGLATAIGSAAGTAAGVATVDTLVTAIGSMTGTADGVATVDGVASAISGVVGTADGVATVTGEASSVAGTVAAADGLAMVDGLATAIGSATGTADGMANADAVVTAIMSATGTADGTSTVDGFTASIASVLGTADGTSTVDGMAASLAGTVGTADGVATVSGSTGTIAGTVGTVVIGEGGGEEIIVVRRPLYLFDD